MEVQYFNDYKHNYMIVKSEKEKENNYSYKMLSTGRVEGLLNYTIRHIDRLTYLYYDISSKTTLLYRFQSKKMSFQDLQEFFIQLGRTCEVMNTYLLDNSNLVLSPEYIYYDLGQGQYLFMYYQDQLYDIAKHYEILMEFLLDHIDTVDSRLTDCVYQIYEMSENVQFTVQDAIHILDSFSDHSDNVWNCEPITDGIGDNGSLFSDFDSVKRESREYDNSFCNSVQTANEAKHKYCVHENNCKSSKLLYFVFLVLSLSGIAGSLSVYCLFRLTETEALVVFGCIAVMALCAIVCVSRIARNEKTESVLHSSQGNQEALSENNLMSVNTSYVPIDQIISKEMSGYHDIKEIQKYVKGDGPESHGELMDLRGENTDTVFVDSFSVVENKLYALDKKNKNHLELNRFPCTVGKMPGCVDFVVADDSVSRLHARFSMENGHIYLTDLNSTNGTYKNGLRMQPQETVEIEPGDEIKFGKLRYCFR